MPEKSFQWYREEMRTRMASLKVRETGYAEKRYVRPLDERLAQCIWQDSLFLHGKLTTDSGKDLAIIQTGRWNQEEGPDFKDAHILIAGKPLRGDVEIHLQANGWKQHRHHRNPLYDAVILHAYLHEAPPSEPARNTLGEPIEGFCMEPHLFPDLESIRQTVQVEDYPYHTPSAHGQCHGLMCSLEENFIAGMLDAAGKERLQEKATRFASQAGGESLEQVFYQALMTSMGHGSNKSLYFLLSKRAPLYEMFDYLSDRGGDQVVPLFESILLHVAQLVPPREQWEAEIDGETRQYLEELEEMWQPVAGYYADRLIPPTRQWMTGVRPANFPGRRLAGVSQVLARFFGGGGAIAHFADIVRTFEMPDTPRKAQTWIRRNLMQPFVIDTTEDFWAWRYGFKGRRASRPMKLIGESRAASLVLNSLLPLLLIHAQQQDDRDLEYRLWQIFFLFPPLESNTMIRHMKARLFGNADRGKVLLKTEARQQALFHIFRECCNQNAKGCEECYYSSSRNYEKQ